MSNSNTPNNPNESQPSQDQELTYNYDFSKDPQTLTYEKIAEDAQNKAEEAVKRILGDFDDDDINHKLSLKKNQRFEMELLIQKMYKNYYLEQNFKKREEFLTGELRQISKEIGQLKGGLKLWEGGKLDIKEMCKAFSEWILKAGLAFITVFSTASFIDPNFKDNVNTFYILSNQGIIFWLCVFSGVSLVELASASIYNWFTSEPSTKNNNSHLYIKDRRPIDFVIKNLRPVYGLMFLIWVAEAFLGYSLIHTLQQERVRSLILYGLYSSTVEFAFPLQNNVIDLLSLFLGVSMFALVNLIFAFSKAKRDNSVTVVKRKLEAYSEYRNCLEDEIDFCSERADEAQERFEKDHERFTELLYGEEEKNEQHSDNAWKFW
jgi:hypothetical protein